MEVRPRQLSCSVSSRTGARELCVHIEQASGGSCAVTLTAPRTVGVLLCAHGEELRSRLGNASRSVKTNKRKDPTKSK